LARRLIELFGALADGVAVSGHFSSAQAVNLVVEGIHLVLVPFFVDCGLVLVVDPLVGLQVMPQVADVLHDVWLHHVWVFDHNPRANLPQSEPAGRTYLFHENCVSTEALFRFLKFGGQLGQPGYL
jgi:hypothetical protein